MGNIEAKPAYDEDDPPELLPSSATITSRASFSARNTPQLDSGNAAGSSGAAIGTGLIKSLGARN